VRNDFDNAFHDASFYLHGRAILMPDDGFDRSWLMFEATLLQKEAQMGIDSITYGTRSMVESGRQLMRDRSTGRPGTSLPVSGVGSPWAVS